MTLAISPIDRVQAANITLFNTGVDNSGHVLADGASESHYTLTSVAGGTSNLITRTSVGGYPIPPWLGDNSASDWIGPNNDAALNSLPGSYTYRTTFSLEGLDKDTAKITGQWSTDNSGLQILLNNVDIGVANGSTNGGFTSFSTFDIPVGSNFLADNNTLDFIVSNAQNRPGDDTANPTGLRVELSGTANPTVPEPSDLLGTAIAFGSVVLLKRHLTAKAQQHKNRASDIISAAG